MPVRQQEGRAQESAPGSVRWTLTGACGGAALGLTLGGSVGALLGAVAGAAGGQLRDSTGKSAAEHYETLPAEERERLFRQAASQAGVQGGGAGGAPSLSRAELRAIPSSRAPSEAVSCKVCMDRLITVALRPCGHACTCARCLLRLMDQRGGAVQCPVCRRAVEGSQRVFL